jgi:DNA-binding response OmpR family regulator
MVASVLIVEGDELVRGLTAEILEENGFTVAEAPTLASAYEQLAADPDEFDVLLVDSSLPDGNGLDFAAALRGLRFDRPIIATSGNCREISRAAECGASAWMQKPFSVSSLLQIVNASVTLHANHVRGAIQAPASSPPLVS